MYRKYKNGLSWFRIDSPDSFEEIRMLGSKYLRTQHEVKILPDRNLLWDLLFNYQDMAEEVTAAEYDAVRSKVD